MSNKKIITRLVSTILALVTVFVLIGCLSGCKESAKNDKKIEYASLTFTVLTETTPKKKIVTEQKDIKAVLDFVEKLEKTKNENQESVNGWQISLSFDGENKRTITFGSNMMTDDKTIYTVSDNAIQELYAFYETLNYTETDFNE